MSKIFDSALSQVPDEVKRFVDNSIEVANQIHSILERQGKTQRDLAVALGKSESEISKWLTGTHNFTLKSISKIETMLNEKIITTPLQSHNDFLKMTENAEQFLKVRASSYLALIKQRSKPKFSEIMNAGHKANTSEKVNSDAGGELQPYAMAA